MQRLIAILLMIVVLVFPVLGQDDPVLKTQEKLIVQIKQLTETNTLLEEKIIALEKTNTSLSKIITLTEAQIDDLHTAINLLAEKEANYVAIIANKDKELALKDQQIELYKKKVKKAERKSKITTGAGFVIGVALGLKLAN